MYLVGSPIGLEQAQAKPPETVIEKLQEKMDKANQYDANREAHERISRLENEARIAIVGLCEEIEQLKKELKFLVDRIVEKK